MNSNFLLGSSIWANSPQGGERWTKERRQPAAMGVKLNVRTCDRNPREDLRKKNSTKAKATNSQAGARPPRKKNSSSHQLGNVHE